MKRILSLALICVILAVSLAPKVAASEVEVSDALFDVLSYSFPNGGSGLTVYADTNGLASARFTIPTSGVMQYVDCIFFCSQSLTSDLTVQFGGGSAWHTLTVVNIANNMYRAYGQFSHSSSYFYINIQADGLRWVTFRTCNISYNKLEHYNIEAYCDVNSSDFSGTIHYVPTDVINYRFFEAGTDYLNLDLACFLYTDVWKKYDYLEFMISLGCQSVNSVSASMGQTVLPCEVSYIDNDMTTVNNYYITIRIDVSELNKVTDDYPQIIISASLTPDAINSVSVLNASGFLKSANGNFLFYLFRDLTNNLRSWFTTLYKSLNGDTSSGDAFKEDSAELITGLDDISASMDSVQRPSMDSINTDFTGDISDASVLMAGLFTEVTEIPWFSTIILASCTLGLISYILYGKD